MLLSLPATMQTQFTILSALLCQQPHRHILSPHPVFSLLCSLLFIELPEYGIHSTARIVYQRSLLAQTAQENQCLSAEMLVDAQMRLLMQNKCCLVHTWLVKEI